MTKRKPCPKCKTPVECITGGLGAGLPFEVANDRANPDHVRRHTPARCKEAQKGARR